MSSTDHRFVGSIIAEPKIPPRLLRMHKRMHLLIPSLDKCGWTHQEEQPM